MSNKIRNIFFVIGLVAIVVMCFSFEVSFIDLWRYITQAGYWLAAVIALWGVLYMMNALTWKVILQGSGDVPVSYWKLLKLTISGFALNYTTPVGLLGGEPYKIMEIQPYVGTQRATSSVVLFAMMHIFAHFSFWLTAIILYIVLFLIGNLPMDALTTTLLLLMTVFCGTGIYLFVKGYENGMVVKLINITGHIPGLKSWSKRFAEKHKEDLKKIDIQISELHGQNRKSFWGSFMLEYIGRILQSTEIYFMLLLFDINDSHILLFVHSFLILAFTSLFANLLFFLPLQLGGREGGFAMSTSQMGMTNEIGLFISIITRVRELFWAAIGLILMRIGTEQIRKNENIQIRKNEKQVS